MNPDLRAKLEKYLSSYTDITAKLSTQEVYSDRELMKTLNQELTQLEPSVKLFQKYLDLEKSIKDTREILDDEDKEIRSIAQEELKSYQEELSITEKKLLRQQFKKILMTLETYTWR